MTALRAVDDAPNHILAVREQRVLALLADGYITTEIADELGYAPRTVKNIVHDILTKLNARTRAHAVALAIASGWLQHEATVEGAYAYVTRLESELIGMRAQVTHAESILRGALRQPRG